METVEPSAMVAVVFAALAPGLAFEIAAELFVTFATARVCLGAMFDARFSSDERQNITLLNILNL